MYTTLDELNADIDIGKLPSPVEMIAASRNERDIRMDAVLADLSFREREA